MKDSFTREETNIKSGLSPIHLWSLFNSLDFWLDILPKKTTQLSLDGKLKAGAVGQAVVNGRLYTFNLLAWEKNQTFSLKVSKDSKPLFLLQTDLRPQLKGSLVKLTFFNYQTSFWQKLFPNLGPVGWFRQFTTNLAQIVAEQPPDHTQNQTKDEEPFKLPKGFYLWHKANRYTRELKQALKPFNLTSTQWFILFAISKLNEKDTQLTHEDVAKALKLHPVVVSDIVKTLVRKNLVRKIKPKDNKRAFYLFPSPIGKQTLELSTPVVKRFDQQFFRLQQNVSENDGQK